MIGLEQTVVPLIGKNEFSIESNAMILSFIASFGLVRAILNLYAGSLAEKWGRKKVLILGWLFGIPIPFILLFAPDWKWIIFANVLLGVNQALPWSMTVNMKIDLMGKERRGLALGLNEFAGYLSVAVVGFATGYLASVYGLKHIHFTLELALSLLVYCFLSLLSGIQRSSCILRLKTIRCRKEGSRDRDGSLSFRQVFSQTSWQSRTLLSVSQAGLVNNLIFDVSWGWS